MSSGATSESARTTPSGSMSETRPSAAPASARTSARPLRHHPGVAHRLPHEPRVALQLRLRVRLQAPHQGGGDEPLRAAEAHHHERHREGEQPRAEPPPARGRHWGLTGTPAFATSETPSESTAHDESTASRRSPRPSPGRPVLLTTYAPARRAAPRPTAPPRARARRPRAARGRSPRGASTPRPAAPPARRGTDHSAAHPHRDDVSGAQRDRRHHGLSRGVAQGRAQGAHAARELRERDAHDHRARHELQRAEHLVAADVLLHDQREGAHGEDRGGVGDRDGRAEGEGVAGAPGNLRGATRPRGPCRAPGRQGAARPQREGQEQREEREARERAGSRSRATRRAPSLAPGRRRGCAARGARGCRRPRRGARG